MKTKEELKAEFFQAIDAHAKEIEAYHHSIHTHPELGYKEVYTTDLTYNALKELGLSVDRDIAVTGVRAYANAEKKGPKVAVMGELDAIVCPQHQLSNKETGAAHACGHSMQMAHMYGVALGLVKSGVLSELDGKVDFIGIPAEEGLDLNYRANLIKEGVIKYIGGKPEYMSRGGFDDVDMVLMMHSSDFPAPYKVGLNLKAIGFLTKRIIFKGKTAHAGAAPHLGINALNAANLGLTAIHFLRETFQEEDCIRIHPIITKGGDGVNSVPDEVIIESYIRAANVNAMKKTNNAVNRALKGAAYAIGCDVEIIDSPGYMPFAPDPVLEKIYRKNAIDLLGSEAVLEEAGLLKGSLDLGNLSLLKPCIHPMVGGIAGSLHSEEFTLTSAMDAFINPAKLAGATIIDLLFDQAKEAQVVIDSFKPAMSESEYQALMDSFEATHHSIKEL